MTRTTLGMIVICTLFVWGCNTSTEPKQEAKGGNAVKPLCRPHMVTDGPYSQFISLDSANKMLTSYLASINAPANDSDLRAVIFNADSLRNYLADTSIKNIKIMLSHTLNYVNNGGSGQNCGYQSGEFTFILAGYNRLGNYVYYPLNTVLESGVPCPYHCPAVGTAANALLPN